MKMSKKIKTFKFKGWDEDGNKIVFKLKGKDSSGKPIVTDEDGSPIPETSQPPYDEDDVIIELLVSQNPTWVKIGGRWYKVG